MVPRCQKSSMCLLCFSHWTVDLMYSCCYEREWNYVQLWTTFFILDRSVQTKFAIKVDHGRGGGITMQKDINVIFSSRCTCKQDYLLKLRLFTKICTLLYIWVLKRIRSVSFARELSSVLFFLFFNNARLILL